MTDEFRLAVEAEDVDFKAYARHFEHPAEEDGRVGIGVAWPPG